MAETPVWRRPTSSGWRVVVDDARTDLEVLDPNGNLQARVPIRPTGTFTGRFAKRMNATTDDAFESLGPQLTAARKSVPIHLGATESAGTLTPGAADGRRSTKSVVVELRGRTYVLRHTSEKKAEAIRNGTLIVRFENRRVNGRTHVERTDLAPLDSTDEITLTIFEKLARPGRCGAISDVVTALSNL